MDVRPQTPPLLAVTPVANLKVQKDQDRWLIEGLWAQSAIGVLGGPAKCFKTWLGLEMAVAVATGTDALGHFPTRQQGPVLVYLAEDSLSQVRARVEALCRGRGLDLKNLPLHVITEASLRLDLELDLKRLASTIDAIRPHLLVLDPLVRMHRLDENSASEISGLLSNVREMQRRFDVAILLAHHASKKARAHPGQALRGSSDLHALGDSNLYVTRRPQGILLTVEQRAARSPDPMWMDLVVKDEQRTAVLRVRPLDQKAAQPGRDLGNAIIDVLARASGPIPRGELRKRVGVNNQRLGEVLARLGDQGQVERVAGGLVLGCRRELERNQQNPGEAEAGNAGAQPTEE